MRTSHRFLVVATLLAVAMSSPVATAAPSDCIEVPGSPVAASACHDPAPSEGECEYDVHLLVADRHFHSGHFCRA